MTIVHRWEASMNGIRSCAILLAGLLAACGGSSSATVGGMGNDGDASADASSSADSTTNTTTGDDASGTGIGNMQPGSGCTVATECQSLNCTNGMCGSACTSDG